MKDTKELPADFLDVKDLFFKPLQCFIVHNNVGINYKMRLSESSLTHIWSWICSEISKTQIQSVNALFLNAVKSNDYKKIFIIFEEIYNDFIQNYENLKQTIHIDEISYNKFAERIGGVEVAKAVEDIAYLLKHRVCIAQIIQEIKLIESNVTDSFVSKIKKIAIADNMEFPQIAIIFTHIQYYFNSEPQPILRYMYANTNNIIYSNNLMSNEFLPCLEFLLYLLEWRYNNLEVAIKNNSNTDTAIQEATEYYILARVLTSEIEFVKKDRIGTQFLNLRNKMTDLIRHDLNDLMPQLNAIFRFIKAPKDSKEFPDETMLSLENKLKLFNVVRSMGSEIALNDYMRNIKNTSDKSFESTTDYLLQLEEKSDEQNIDNLNFKLNIFLRVASAMYDDNFVLKLKKNFSTLGLQRIAS